MATPRKTASAKKSAGPAKKAAAKKTSVRKKTATRAAGPAKKPTASPAPGLPPVTPEHRHRRIAEAAYFIALRKGFEKSDPQQNWFEAEMEVDAQLARDAQR